MKTPTDKFEENVVRELNKPSKSVRFNLIRCHIGETATLPSLYAESPPYKSGAELQPLRSPDAVYESYWTLLDLLVGDINDALGSNLRLQFGTKTLKKYRSEAGELSLPACGEFDESLNPLDGIEQVVNDDYNSHVKQSRAVIRTGGKFIVVGDIPKRPRPEARAKHLAWLLAKILQSPSFDRLRKCRKIGCDNFFFTKNRRRKVCPGCEFDSTASNRVKEKRGRDKNTAQDLVRKQQHDTRLKEEVTVFERCFLDRCKKTYGTEEGRFVDRVMGSGTIEKLDKCRGSDPTAVEKFWRDCPTEKKEIIRKSKFWKTSGWSG